MGEKRNCLSIVILLYCKMLKKKKSVSIVILLYCKMLKNIVVYVKDSYVILYCGVLKDVCTTE